MTDTRAFFDDAVAAQRAGRHDDARAGYESVLAAEPFHVLARYNLGVLEFQQGAYAEAAEAFRCALAQAPERADVRVALARVCQRLGDNDEARRQFERALDIDPNLRSARQNLAVLLIESNQLDEAEKTIAPALNETPNDGTFLALKARCLTRQDKLDDGIAAWREAVAAAPENVTHRIELAHALRRRGDRDEALAITEKCAADAPDNVNALNAFALMLGEARRDEEAADLYRRALKLQPGNQHLIQNLARHYDSMSRYSESIPLWRTRVQAAPNDPMSHFCLANALTGLRNFEEAIEVYEEALKIDPNHMPSLINMATALSNKGRIQDAIDAYEKVLRARPNFAEVRSNYGNILKDIGLAEESVDHYRRAFALNPKFLPARNNLLMAIHYMPDIAPREVFEEHVRAGIEIAGSKAIPAAPKRDRDPARRLKVGYVSPDYRVHPVGYFIEPLLRGHDRDAVETFGYHCSGRPDSATERIKALFDHWCEARRLDDDALDERIRKDEIDILVDLTGHTANNRLAVFARRPAPVQVTYLGYPDTTGIPAIGYRLTDAWADPPGESDDFATEQLIRLPHGFLSYRPPADSPDVGPLPAASAGHATFVSFNNLSKTHPRVLATWAEILTKAPSSRLRLKSRMFRDDRTRERFFDTFAGHGIDRERIDLIDSVPSVTEHLDQYNATDIALDTFPYNGATTTCEALWMGVPVVTVAGHSHVARVGVSLLNAIGITETIADDRDEYVRIAVELANDVERLAALRAKIRPAMQAAPCHDPKTFARDVEAAYRGMWERFCEAGN